VLKNTIYLPLTNILAALLQKYLRKH